MMDFSELQSNPIFQGILETIVKNMPTNVLTDTKPMAQLIAQHYDGDIDVDKLADALSKAMPLKSK